MNLYTCLIYGIILNTFVSLQFLIWDKLSPTRSQPVYGHTAKSYNKVNKPLNILHPGVKPIPVQNWGTKYRPIRVWCVVKSLWKSKTNMLIIQETWGKHCDQLLFMVGDNEQPYIQEMHLQFKNGKTIRNVIQLQLKHTGKNLTSVDLWEKCWRTYEYLYTYYRNDFDWVITADSDAWFSTYNFKGYAQYFDPKQAWYMGHALTNRWRPFNFVFNAGGIFALSSGAIHKLNRIFQTDEFLHGNGSFSTCTGHGSWHDDTHIGLCLKSVGVFPTNTLDEQYRLRWAIASYRTMLRNNLSRFDWYFEDRFELYPVLQNCCTTDPIAFHYFKNQKRRKRHFRYLDQMYTERSKYNWSEFPVPQKPTTFLYNTSFKEIDEYFNVKNPPKGQKLWKGVDNLWNYTNVE